MWDIYAILCNEIVGTCKNCGNLQKMWFYEKEKDSPNTPFSLGYSLSYHKQAYHITESAGNI